MTEKFFKLSLVGMAAMMSLSFSFSGNELACQGILPKNNMKIPVNNYSRFSKERSGISEQEFNKTLETIENLYKQEVEQKNARLIVVKKWFDEEVNAYAQKTADKLSIVMMGGLARHELMTVDGFAFVACHELGHHLGGAPKNPNLNTWSSAEGASDYYAGLKCFRRFAEQTALQGEIKIPAFAEKACVAKYASSKDREICFRTMKAGEILVGLFLESNETVPDFSTPDTTVMKKFNLYTHPQAQCRLDTVFQAALCDVDSKESMDDKDYRVGSCVEPTHTEGLRPRCWFKAE